MSAPQPGLYRNHLGAELHVGTARDIAGWGLRVIGSDAALATLHDDLFGNIPYIVTAESLADCGYERVTDA